MSKHLHRDLENCQRLILALSAIVEEMIDKASVALIERRTDLAEEVMDTDSVVDQREVQIEEECLKMLALHQPVAIDLRHIITMIKANNDLERIADLAVGVAQRARAIAHYPDFKTPPRISQMVAIARRMVRRALDSFVNFDAAEARAVLAQDDEVDLLNVEVIDELQDVLRSGSNGVEPALHCFSASRHIERMADHATNVAEDVIYLVQGEIVRHQLDLVENEP